MDELFATLIEGIAELNRKQLDLNAQLEGTQQELSGFEDEYAKETNLLQKQIDDISVQIDRLIKEAVRDIMPKDGKDGEDAVVDYDLIKEEIVKLVDALPKPQDGKDAVVDYEYILNQIVLPKIDYDKIEYELKKLISHIPIPEDGKDAEVDYDAIYAKVKEYVDKIEPEKGEKGDDGVSITNIYQDKGIFYIELSDGTTKSFKLPRVKSRTIVGSEPAGSGEKEVFVGEEPVLNYNAITFAPTLISGQQVYTMKVNVL